jgi:hypothetical protein
VKTNKPLLDGGAVAHLVKHAQPGADPNESLVSDQLDLTSQEKNVETPVPSSAPLPAAPPASQFQIHSRSDKRAIHCDVGHLGAPKRLVEDGGDLMGVRTVVVARLECVIVSSSCWRGDEGRPEQEDP